MELNQGVELVAVDRGYLESLVLGKAHAEGQLAQAERTVTSLKSDLKRQADEWRKEAAAGRAENQRLADDNERLVRGLPPHPEPLNTLGTGYVGGGTTSIQTRVTPAMPTAFDSILIRLEPNAARTALGYLGTMNGGPLPDDHALRPVYDRIKQALMGQRAGS